MFGEPEDNGRRPSFEAIVERVEWWAEVFEIPCVAYAASADEVEPLVSAGADFIALGDWVFTDPRGAAAAVAGAAALLAVTEGAA
jgi:thiamine-phosphate pyrophosphorylase